MRLAALTFLLGCVQAKIALAVAPDFTGLKSIPTANVTSLDAYLDLIQSTGRIVVIDCFESGKLAEKPAETGDIISTSFYQLAFNHNICLVSPANPALKSDFLRKRVSSFKVDNADLQQVLAALSKESGVGLAALEMDNRSDGKANRHFNLDMKDRTVEEILIEVAASYKSNRIYLMPGFYAKGERVTKGAFIDFS